MADSDCEHAFKLSGTYKHYDDSGYSRTWIVDSKYFCEKCLETRTKREQQDGPKSPAFYRATPSNHQ